MGHQIWKSVVTPRRTGIGSALVLEEKVCISNIGDDINICHRVVGQNEKKFFGSLIFLVRSGGDTVLFLFSTSSCDSRKLNATSLFFTRCCSNNFPKFLVKY